MVDSPEALQHIIIALAVADSGVLETYAKQQEHELDRLADACMADLNWQKIYFYTDQQTLIKQINKQ